MSDLELAKSKLIDTIGHYNATASNIQKFKFNQLETNVFATMMVEFAKELANEGSKDTEKALAINDVSNSLPNYDEIYRNAQYMDEKEFEDWLYKQQ